MITIKNLHFQPFISKTDIEQRIQQLAEQINQDYAEKTPLFVAVLNGSFMFASDLMKKINIPCEITFVRVASYQLTASSGDVKEILGLKENIENRDIIIVEDIVDTGITMAEIRRQLLAKSPKSLKIATLLSKPTAHQVKMKLDYVGFEIENRFVLGYGLDYDGLGRNLAEIYVLASS